LELKFKFRAFTKNHIVRYVFFRSLLKLIFFDSTLSPIKCRTTRIKLLAFFALLVFLGGNEMKGQTTIFSENMGTSAAGTTAITSNTFQNSSYTFSGTGDTRLTTSSLNYYNGASGIRNVFLTNTIDTYFQISGISTLGYSTLSLSFGAFKSTIASNMSELNLEFSTDGTKYTPLIIPAQATGTLTAVWRLISGISLPVAAQNVSNLRIKWTNTSKIPQFRIDDVTLSALTSISSLNSSSGCIGSNLTITGTNLSNASSVTIGGTAVSSFTINSSTQIVAVVGSGTTGTVSVTTPNETVISANQFTVNPNVTPTFTQIAAICSGATLAALPTTSNNSVTGNWLPAINNTATTTYTFTPTAGQCATTTTMTITVNPNVTTTFTQVAAICSGATLAALPTTSNNSITGTWSPAISNTATTTYTFTPTAGQCASATTMTISVNSNTTPTFTQVAAICSGATLAALPTTSNNSITGTWSPEINNTATTTYTFTPTSGQCATTTTMTINVNPNPSTTPIFHE
jgi:hypothetical protein